MPHDFPVPDTDRLEVLLVQAFAAMQEAEPARLNRLEERLARRLSAAEKKKRPNRIPWWIVLLLAGGFASAAWWAGDALLDEKTSTDMPVDEHTTGQPLSREDSPAKESRPGNTDEQYRSPIIYQRGE